MDEDRTIRPGGVFDPEVCLPDVLQDGPDTTTLRPEVPAGVVDLDNPRRGREPDLHARRGGHR